MDDELILAGPIPADSPLGLYLMRRRQALIIELGAIEAALALPRSIVPRHKRRPPTTDE